MSGPPRLARRDQPPPDGACHNCGHTRVIPSAHPLLWECVNCGRFWESTPARPRFTVITNETQGRS